MSDVELKRVQRITSILNVTARKWPKQAEFGWKICPPNYVVHATKSERECWDRKSQLEDQNQGISSSCMIVTNNCQSAHPALFANLCVENSSTSRKQMEPTCGL